VVAVIRTRDDEEHRYGRGHILELTRDIRRGPARFARSFMTVLKRKRGFPGGQYGVEVLRYEESKLWLRPLERYNEDEWNADWDEGESFSIQRGNGQILLLNMVLELVLIGLVWGMVWWYYTPIALYIGVRSGVRNGIEVVFHFSKYHFPTSSHNYRIRLT
jgi:hypothetical protein